MVGHQLMRTRPLVLCRYTHDLRCCYFAVLFSCWLLLALVSPPLSSLPSWHPPCPPPKALGCCRYPPPPAATRLAAFLFFLMCRLTVSLCWIIITGNTQSPFPMVQINDKHLVLSCLLFTCCQLQIVKHVLQPFKIVAAFYPVFLILDPLLCSLNWSARRYAFFPSYSLIKASVH